MTLTLKQPPPAMLKDVLGEVRKCLPAVRWGSGGAARSEEPAHKKFTKAQISCMDDLIDFNLFI